MKIVSGWRKASKRECLHMASSEIDEILLSSGDEASRALWAEVMKARQAREAAEARRDAFLRSVGR